MTDIMPPEDHLLGKSAGGVTQKYWRWGGHAGHALKIHKRKSIAIKKIVIAHDLRLMFFCRVTSHHITNNTMKLKSLLTLGLILPISAQAA